MNHNILHSLLFSFYLGLSFTGTGYFILERMLYKKQSLPFLLKISASFATGFGLYCLIYFGYYIWGKEPGLPFIIILQLPGIIGAIAIYKPLLDYIKKGFRLFLSRNLTDKIIFILLGLAGGGLIMILGFNAVAPLKIGDSITGYVETARWIYHNGLRSFDPINAWYSTMPVFTEIIYSLSFSIHTEIGAKCFDTIVSLMFLAGIFGFSRLFMSRTLAFYTVLSMLCVLQFRWLFGGAKIDFEPQLFYFISIAILIVNLKFLNLRSIILAAFLLGISLGQKDTMALFIPSFFLVLMYVLLYNKIAFKKIAAFVVLSGLFIFLLVLPQFIKDYIWLRNPFAPFSNPLFKGTATFPWHPNEEINLFYWKETLLFPYTIFLKNRWPLPILIGLVFLLINRKVNKELMPVFWILIFQFIVWIVAFQQYWFIERYIFGIIAFLFFFGFLGFSNLYDKYAIVKGGLFVFFFASLIYLSYSDVRFVKYYKYILGIQSEESWQDEFNSQHGANLLKKISPLLSDSNKLFILWGRVEYYIPYKSLAYSGHLDLDGVTDKYAYLRAHHYKYMFFNGDTPLPEWVKKDSIFMKEQDCYIYKL